MNNLHNDLTAYAVRKLHKANQDTLQACDIAEVEDIDTVKIIMSALLSELVKGAATLQLNESDFIKLCRSAYRQIYQDACRVLDQ